MSISSVQQDYLITSSDTITITPSPTVNTITISGGSSYTTYSGSGSSYYMPTSGLSAVSISPITLSDLEYAVSEEWKNTFPDFDRVQAMCKEYPGLKIAYEKFVTTYKLVKDHYDNPENKK